MKIKREISKELKNLIKTYPVVTITGPRQSGKTTLTRMEFPEYTYCNLENPEIRNFALTDPNAFFDQFPCPLIIDEIQRVPELLSYIQVIVDERQEKGMFILTGSHQLDLNQAVTQSLAGRTALLHLLPLSIKELDSRGISMDRDEYIFKGFLPGIYKNVNFFKGVKYFNKITSRAPEGYLIYAGDFTPDSGAGKVKHFKDIYQIFE